MAKWQPQPDDYSRVLHEQNPWHRSNSVPTALAPSTERALAPVLWRRLVHDEPRRHQVVLGPRRVGKTTVLYQTVQHLINADIAPDRIWWLRMDHPMLNNLSLGEIVRILLRMPDVNHSRPLYLMLDEIVYANQWDLWLKTFHDENWPVRIAATSSSNTALRTQRHESGVGRWEEHHLLPCDLEEVLRLASVPRETRPGDTLAATIDSLPTGCRDDPQLEAYRRLLMFVGGFPELLTRTVASASRQVPDGDQGSAQDSSIHHSDFVNHILESQRVLRSGAVERAVYKDIPQAFGVDNPLLLERLMYVLAGQATGILSPQNVSKYLGITQPTLERYISYLEQSYLVFALTNYSGSEAGVQRRGRKLCFPDGAVRNAALLRGTAPLSDPDEQGMLLENLAAASLNTLALHTGVRLHHWRRGDELEVDLIYDDPRSPLAFEIASSSNHSLKGLTALIKQYPRFSGHSYLVAPQNAFGHALESRSGIGRLPFDTFLLAVGAQARQAMLNRLGVNG